MTFWLPAVRERGHDILILAEHFLARACADYGIARKTLAPEAREALLAYAWPGNVRELSNVVERVALLDDAPAVSAAMLGLPAIPAESARIAAEGSDRAQLLEALRDSQWNLSRTAARLGITRNTVRYRVEKYGLRPEMPTSASASGPPEPPPAPPLPAARAEVLAPAIQWDRRRIAFLRAVLIPPRAEMPSVYLNRALEFVVDKLHTFGGRVETLSSTEVVAAFGLEPVDEVPGRAAHAALAIHNRAEQARAADVEQPGVAIAIHADQLRVGQAGGMARLDDNDARAARAVLDALLESPEAGAIFVSGAGAALLRRRFDLVAADRAETYRLLGREGASPGRRQAQFVGRRLELDLLRNRLATAVRGHGQLVGIGGEAGIGKSRLLFEFRRTLGAERVAYLEGRCVSYGTAIPFLPVIELLRMGYRIAETDSSETIVAKIRRGSQGLDIDADEVVPYFLHLLGVREGTERLAALSPEAIQSRTFEILRQTTVASSRRRPLIIAIEDAHWIDSASDAYLTALAESLPGAAVLLLATYRPERRPGWLDKSYATHVALAPLSPEDGLTVVQSIPRADQIADPVMRQVLAKAEGNPLFLEELARAVVEQGDLQLTVSVPDTIQAVLETRIDRLPDVLRQLVQVSAVLGRTVSGRLLSALWDGPPLAPLLHELTQLEFFYRQGGVEAVYVFQHAMMREVARDSVPPARRYALHAAAGRALEELFEDRVEEVCDRLAYHYSKSRDSERAVEFLGRLAARAARTYSHAEAVIAFGEAIEHAERLRPEERDPRVLDLVLRQAHSLTILGRFRDALDSLLREAPRVERLPSRALAGPYHFWLGMTHSYLGDQDAAARHAERALEEARRCDDDATTGKAYFLLAQETSWSGEARQGLEYGERAVACLERTGERWWLGMAQWIVGIHYITLGRFDEALDAEGRALATGDAIGDPRIRSYATWMIGWIHALHGESDAAIDACQRGLEMSPDPVNSTIVRGHLGYAFFEQGDLARALPLLERSVTEIGQFGFRRLEARFLTFLGEAELAAGRPDRARELVTRSLVIARDVRYPYGFGWAALALGRIHLASGALADAAASFEEALHTFEPMGARFMIGRTQLAVAELAARREDREATVRALTEAHRIFTALGVRRHRERAEELARRVGAGLPSPCVEGKAGS
jgi:tetratricopeptide (TPR) repeat protein